MPILAVIAALFVGVLLFARRASAASAGDDVGEIEVTATRIPTTPTPSQPLSSRASPIRGLRNRNPGNLRFVPSINWRGQTGADNEGYAVFDTDANGLRAAIINLRTAMTRHSRNTIRAIITRWAPSHENPTDAYINFVARETRLAADAPLNFITHGPALMRSIVRFEIGMQPYDETFYTQAFKAAA